LKLVWLSRWFDWIILFALVVGLVLMGASDLALVALAAAGGTALVRAAVPPRAKSKDAVTLDWSGFLNFPLIVAVVVVVALRRRGVIQTAVLWHEFVVVLGVAVVTVVLLTVLWDAIRRKMLSISKE